MNSKNKLTITVTKIQRQTLQLPVTRLRCPACDAEFEIPSALPAGATNPEEGLTQRPTKAK